MKKYLLILTTIALSFAACTNDEDFGLQTDSSSTSAIEFRTMDEEKTSNTRALVTTSNTITSFTLTAWWDKEKTVTTGEPSDNYGDPLATKGVYLFNAFNIARGESNGTPWDYNPKRYFPATGKGYVDFYAYSPASSRNLLTGIEDFGNDHLIDYEVPTLLDEQAVDPSRKVQEDFMIAKVLEKNSGPINLNFLHALSRVTFSARKTNPDITYIVKSVELVNLSSRAELKLTDEEIPVSGPFDYANGTTPLVIWDDHNSATTTYGVDMGDSPVFLQYDAIDASQKTYYSLFGDINGLMVMPQETTTFTGSAPTTEFAIKVTYKAYLRDFYYAGNTTDYAVKYFPVTISGYPIAFEIGRQYNFLLTFGEEAADAIKFIVAVSDWAADAGTILPQFDDYAPFLSQRLIDLIDTGAKNGEITYDELAAFTTLTFDFAPTAEDLKGLEYLFALTTVNFIQSAGNINSDIKFASTHINLNMITVSYNDYSKIDISELPAQTITIGGTSNYSIITLIRRANQVVNNTSGINIINEVDPESNPL